MIYLYIIDKIKLLLKKLNKKIIYLVVINQNPLSLILKSYIFIKIRKKIHARFSVQ